MKLRLNQDLSITSWSNGGVVVTQEWGDYSEAQANKLISSTWKGLPLVEKKTRKKAASVPDEETMTETEQGDNHGS